MNEKELVIICVTALLCVCIVCGTVLLTNNQNQNNTTDNSSVNNTTVNSTVNDTNDTDNTTTQKATSSKSSNKKSSSSSSSGDDVATVDSNGNRIFREGEWVGRGPGGSHIYKDPKTGQLFDSGGNLPKNYKYSSK